jgi:hypothetical protein
MLLKQLLQHTTPQTKLLLNAFSSGSLLTDSSGLNKVVTNINGATFIVSTPF